jgi:hypothetical protein
MNNTTINIDPNISISELIETYPFLVDFLQSEYGFHCVNCLYSEFDTLIEGAEIHGIIGEDFEELLSAVEDQINQSG